MSKEQLQTDFEKFFKQAQEFFNEQPNLNQNLQQQDQKLTSTLEDSARSLIDNLKSQLLGNSTITSGRDDTELNVAHLVSLNAFLNFLEFNKIKFNEYILVLKTNPNNYKYISYEQFFIFKDGVIAYLQQLQNKNIPILNTMIAKIIDQLNSKLKLNISKEHPKKPVTNVAGPDSTPEINPVKENPSAKMQAFKDKQSQLEMLHQLIEALPFSNQDVDFLRISRFFNLYQTYIQTYKQNLANQRLTRAENSVSTMQQVLGQMNIAKSFLNSDRYNFPTYNLTPLDLKGWLKPQAQGKVYIFLSTLRNVVQYAAEVVRAFSIDNIDSLLQDNRAKSIFTPEEIELVHQQFGEGSHSNRNKLDIERMMNNLQQYSKLP